MDSYFFQVYLHVSECIEPEWNSNLALRFRIPSIYLLPHPHIALSISIYLSYSSFTHVHIADATGSITCSHIVATTDIRSSNAYCIWLLWRSGVTLRIILIPASLVVQLSQKPWHFVFLLQKNNYLIHGSFGTFSHFQYRKHCTNY